MIALLVRLCANSIINVVYCRRHFAGDVAVCALL